MTECVGLVVMDELVTEMTGCAALVTAEMISSSKLSETVGLVTAEPTESTKRAQLVTAEIVSSKTTGNVGLVIATSETTGSVGLVISTSETTGSGGQVMVEPVSETTVCAVLAAKLGCSVD